MTRLNPSLAEIFFAINLPFTTGGAKLYSGLKNSAQAGMVLTQGSTRMEMFIYGPAPTRWKEGLSRMKRVLWY